MFIHMVAICYDDASLQLGNGAQAPKADTEVPQLGTSGVAVLTHEAPPALESLQGTSTTTTASALRFLERLSPATPARGTLVQPLPARPHTARASGVDKPGQSQ